MTAVWLFLRMYTPFLRAFSYNAYLSVGEENGAF